MVGAPLPLIQLEVFATYELTKITAPAQGILGQFRILGGSLGIAASSAILGVKQRAELAGIVSQQQLASLSAGDSGLTPAQYDAVRQAYADAFTQDMKVSAIVVSIGLLFTFGVYRRNRLTIEKQREAQIAEEQAWRRASRTPVLSTPVVTDVA